MESKSHLLDSLPPREAAAKSFVRRQNLSVQKARSPCVQGGVTAAPRPRLAGTLVLRAQASIDDVQRP